MSSLQRTRSQRKAPGSLPVEPSSHSRLPVKPALMTTTTTTTASGSRARPVSAVLERRPTTTTTSTTSSTTRIRSGGARPLSALLDHRSSSSTPSQGSLGRSSSTRVPSSGIGAEQRRVPPTHTRAKSIATAGWAAPSPGENKASATATTSSVSWHQQHQQQRPRPAFSTLQQHYTPAKKAASKPLTSTFLAPPSPSKLPANVAASAQVQRLQTELLQLHLLHRDAASVQDQWHDSAREKLGRRFVALGKASRAVAEREAVVDRHHNLDALGRWRQAGCLEEWLQILGHVLDGLWTLTGSSGGRFRRMERDFDRWADGLRRIEAARRADDGDSDYALVGFLDEELDASWKDDCAVLTNRLLAWQDQLSLLTDIESLTDDDNDDARPTSGLERMLMGARSLLRCMLAELRAMDDIEREARMREVEWVSRMNEANDDDDDDETDADADDDDDTPGGVAVWRVL
ncbi:hypothetical protein CP533_0794 [Ophiocordyceps camponoti-saundersi (nom. inval.)]|nr:hypothetical protein CP533_0794 [Ophiocordyceps camponoti-saundersi (nom. inval.)]